MCIRDSAIADSNRKLLRGLQIVITCKELKFDAGEIEPLFCSLAVYDQAKKTKVTESFHFDMNTGSLAQLPQRLDTALANAKDMIFSIFEPNPNLFLVFRLEGIIRGSADSAVDIYSKYSTVCYFFFACFFTDL
eukprot:TRINITY_DN465_c0_g1_i1.p1 TRINITY_DN465_c0_g1~~TRINITY_DN465_c0_g1_i1.p1  ORF type:complete len:134 (-),score=20.01 TRINITY_DN465_c0_g1_i1:20-421(-)